MADSYAQNLLSLIRGFEYELCSECGGDLADHVFSPDPLGNPHAWCRPDEDSQLDVRVGQLPQHPDPFPSESAAVQAWIDQVEVRCAGCNVHLLRDHGVWRHSSDAPVHCDNPRPDIMDRCAPVDLVDPPAPWESQS